MTTFISFVVDESGSMESKRADVIGGFNQYISDLKDTRGLRFSLTKFNTESHLIFSDYKLESVPVFSVANYNPNGGTALLDAVAKTVLAVDGKLKKNDKSLVIIMTDGEENSSVEFRDSNRVKALIEERQGSGHWTFIYLGVGVDKWAAQTFTSSISLSSENIAVYRVNNTKGAMRDISSATVAYASASSGYDPSLLADNKTEDSEDTVN